MIWWGRCGVTATDEEGDVWFKVELARVEEEVI